MMITSKGQVTIPKEIRDAYGLYPHTEAEFVVVGDEVVVRPAMAQASERGARMVEALLGKGDVNGLSTDDIMRMTRGED